MTRNDEIIIQHGVTAKPITLGLISATILIFCVSDNKGKILRDGLHIAQLWKYRSKTYRVIMFYFDIYDKQKNVNEILRYQY